MITKIKNLYADSLFRNSFYLMVNTATQGAIGFFFWLICARIYDPSNVGLATSLISGASLTSVFSMLGFNNVIVRFLPTSKRKNEQLSTAFILTAIASFFAAGAFLWWAIATHSPSIQTSHLTLLIFIFVIYVFAITLNSILDTAFIANRATQYILIKNIFLSTLKLLLLFVIVNIGFIGIVGATASATLTAFILGFIWLIIKFKYRPKLTVDKETIEETKRFAIGNYFGTLFGVLPSTTLVLIVVSRLSPEAAAFFYVPSMIVTLLNVIPGSTAQSLFAEVSHDEDNFIKYFKKAVKHLFSFLIPAVIGILIFGPFALRIFGPKYAAAGTLPLAILAVSSLIGAANYLGDTLLNIKRLPGMYLFMNALNAILVIVPAYIFAPYGLPAIAWSVLVGQIIVAIIYIIMNWDLLAELRTVRS